MLECRRPITATITKAGWSSAPLVKKKDQHTGDFNHSTRMAFISMQNSSLAIQETRHEASQSRIVVYRPRRTYKRFLRLLRSQSVHAV